MAKQQKTSEKKPATTPNVKGLQRVKANPTSKLARLEAMLRRPDGATIAQMSKALDWQKHSVRGAMSGSLGKRGVEITSTKGEGADRVYRAN